VSNISSQDRRFDPADDARTLAPFCNFTLTLSRVASRVAARRADTREGTRVKNERPDARYTRAIWKRRGAGVMRSISEDSARPLISGFHGD
jgi:hypothetical protein